MLNTEINGRPATVGDVHRAVTWNYGHFTSMQVRDGAVRGLELHLRRLEAASRELFAHAAGIDGDRIRGPVRHALGDERAASVRVSVLPAVTAPSATDVMVSVSDPVADAPAPARRVVTTTYERDLPHLKHMATLGLTYRALQAREAGFDDVLFVGRDGYLREGSVWNVAFWDGERVLWPEAEVLTGITMQLLRSGLDGTGVPWAIRRLTKNALPALRAAAATNSHCPGQPLASIDEVTFPDDGTLTRALNAAWAEIPWEALQARCRAIC
ncbi:aminotransferase class IV [Streptomyces sp. NBC_00503]|uniref:aminotransferase class IV n=1 Tax=Streptomyces sp. NBC_00503 TaxID=2903659 RepID=UPI002E8039C5|nr:aminotransferase class IV [Streptomyces sp. NBC_00503]WUD79345.1 aminotransferase class IV [Streptomyces sp. NBC_00503]